MSDIKCVVCGEPWEACGLSDSMAPWEVSLFRRGAGCPSCEGKAPAHRWAPETLEDIENGDEDPGERLALAEDVDARPPWARPEAIVLWTCECCGVQALDDPGADLPEERVYMRGKSGRAWQSAHAWERDCWCEPIEAPQKAGEHTVCESCIEQCFDCDAVLCGGLSTDTYDGLASFPFEGMRFNHVRCVDCHCEAEAEAEESDEVPV